jgi:hypothetical protein
MLPDRANESHRGAFTRRAVDGDVIRTPAHERKAATAFGSRFGRPCFADASLGVRESRSGVDHRRNEAITVEPAGSRYLAVGSGVFNGVCQRFANRDDEWRELRFRDAECARELSEAPPHERRVARPRRHDKSHGTRRTAWRFFVDSSFLHQYCSSGRPTLKRSGDNPGAKR